MTDRVEIRVKRYQSEAGPVEQFFHRNEQPIETVFGLGTLVGLLAMVGMIVYSFIQRG